MRIDTLNNLMLKKSYKPKMLLKYMKAWKKLANGSNVSYDLGPLTDKRTAQVTILGLHSEVIAVESYLASNKQENTFEVEFDPGEYIFGPEIAYDGVLFTCHVIIRNFKRINFTDSEIEIELTMENSQDVTYLPTSLPEDLSTLVYNYTFSRDVDYFQDLQLNYADKGGVVVSSSETKLFKNTFALTNDEWSAVKQHLLAVRNGTTTLPDLPIKPFGDIAGPYIVRVLSWNERKSDLTFWNVTMSIALEEN